jgi:hypothetical protein
MTHDRDTERILDLWFADGPTQAPDRVIDVVADRIGRQPQRPGRRLHPWRDIHVNTNLKIAAGLAAVLVVAVVGYRFLPGASTGFGSPTPTPTPTAIPSPSLSPATSPSAAPSANAVFPSWFTPSDDSGTAAGILPAGSQTAKSFVPRFTFTVPEGWVNSGDTAGFYGLFPDTPANAAENAASGNLAQEVFMGPHDSPHFVCDAWEDNRGATAAEMVAAILANKALATSEPIDVSIGGLTGKQFDVQLDPAWTDSCPGDPPTLVLGDQRTRAILLDSPDGGVIVIFVGSKHQAGHEAFLAEAMPIVESFQFDTSQ